MTDKVAKILQRMKRPRTLLLTPEARDRVLGELNASTLDPVGSVGGDQGMKVLAEMNSLAEEHDRFMKSLAS